MLTMTMVIIIVNAILTMITIQKGETKDSACHCDLLLSAQPPLRCQPPCRVWDPAQNWKQVPDISFSQLLAHVRMRYDVGLFGVKATCTHIHLLYQYLKTMWISALPPFAIWSGSFFSFTSPGKSVFHWSSYFECIHKFPNICSEYSSIFEDKGGF